MYVYLPSCYIFDFLSPKTSNLIIWFICVLTYVLNSNLFIYGWHLSERGIQYFPSGCLENQIYLFFLYPGGYDYERIYYLDNKRLFHRIYLNLLCFIDFFFIIRIFSQTNSCFRLLAALIHLIKFNKSMDRLGPA